MTQKKLIKFLTLQSEEFHKYSKRVHKDADKRAVHQLRLSIRRIRLMLWLLKKSRRGISDKKLDQKLHNIGEALGEVREIQVALADARTYHLPTKSLKKMNSEPARRIEKMLRHYRRENVERRLKKIIKKSENKKIDLRPAVSALFEKADKWKNRTDFDAVTFHNLRKDLKKFRYFFEVNKLRCSQLEDLLDLIGKVHDLTVLNNLSRSTTAQVNTDYRNLRRKALRLVHPAISALIQVVTKPAFG